MTVWDRLSGELRYGNRFFPDTQIDHERLSELLSHLLIDVDLLPRRWYRARLVEREKSLELSNMGAPPKHLASHGRANPAGIPYLYLGSEVETAISEIRQHTGERACVPEFCAPEDLRIVDLRNPKKTVSPLILGDEEMIGYLRGDIAFLGRLGEELTRPVLPKAAAIDYVPSQYLCEFIKKEGYDGVIYRSAVSSGMNLALFETDRAVPRDVRLIFNSSFRTSGEHCPISP